MYVTTRTETAKVTVSTGRRIRTSDVTGGGGLAQLTSFEMQRHVLANNPSYNNQERGDEEGNLDAGANGYTHSKIHLVSSSDNHGRDVLGRVSHNGDENKTNECFADPGVRHDIINTSHKIFSAHSNEDCGHNQDCAGSDRSHARLLHLWFSCSRGIAVNTGSGSRVLGVEQVAVRSELEDEIHDVEEEEDNGSCSGENQDALVLLIGVCNALVQDGVKLQGYRESA